MKGVIFNLFEDFVCEGFGDDTYEAILDEADIDRALPLATTLPMPARTGYRPCAAASRRLGWPC